MSVPTCGDTALLTCGDFCDELRRIVAALHYAPRPQWEVSAGLRPEQMGFDPLPCTGTGCERQIHPRLRWAFSWARMDQPAGGFENASVDCNADTTHCAKSLPEHSSAPYVPKYTELGACKLASLLYLDLKSLLVTLRRVKVQGSEYRSSHTGQWWWGHPKNS